MVRFDNYSGYIREMVRADNCSGYIREMVRAASPYAPYNPNS